MLVRNGTGNGGSIRRIALREGDMKAVRDACQLQPKALEITVGDQIEELDQIIRDTDGEEYFSKTYVTDGMKTLLTKGIARLASKSGDAVFHLKQAMGGGKTHLMVCFGLLAKDKQLRRDKIGFVPYHDAFDSARVAAFNGRNHPDNYFWGEIARQLGKEDIFSKFWIGGPKAPDKAAWLKLFGDDEGPLLILLDELPPYFHYYNTQTLGNGTIADVATNAFANLLAAAKEKSNVCIVISDLNAAYERGGDLIQSALDDARQELGRAEILITPVNLESNEIYEILRKRLFVRLPGTDEIAEVAAAYAQKLAEAAKAKTVQRSAEALASEIEATYPFHPGFKHIVALFKENEKFKQTRGLMELVSRLLKSVWDSPEGIYLIGAQHFDLSIPDVREKLAEISDMRDVIAKDLWDANGGAHAQAIDASAGNSRAEQTGTLLLLSSLSTAVNAVKGLSEFELYENLIDPLHGASDFKAAFDQLQKSAWYIHHQKDDENDPGRFYFDRQENLTKKLQSYADKAPQNRVDELVRHRLEEMFRPLSKEAYGKVLPLPEIEDAKAALNSHRALLILDPDGKMPPRAVETFFQSLTSKNNMLVLTGEKSGMASVEGKARHVFAAEKMDRELPATHPQRGELEAKKTQYEQDFQATILSVFDTICYPRRAPDGKDVLKHKPLDSSYSSSEPYSGERQVIKTLTSDPIKLYTDVQLHFDPLRSKMEGVLFGAQESLPRTALQDGLRQNTSMPWMPPDGLNRLIALACQNGQWEELDNGYISKNPRPKATRVVVSVESDGDDHGTARLRVDAADAGANPRIHYAEDAPVTENSPVLTESTLTTTALRVQFLAVDPTGKNPTGSPATWENSLVIRNNFDNVTRRLTLHVAPRGTIRYTLDGSEPRNGQEYTNPIQLEKGKVSVAVFAECEGLEAKRTFDFGEAGDDRPAIDPLRPATLATSKAPKKISSASGIREALVLARDRNIKFEGVTLSVNTASVSITGISVGEKELEEGLDYLRRIFNDPDAPVIMTFRKAYFPSGNELESFCEKVGIEIISDEVGQ